MTFYDVVKNRRTTRDFLDKAVEADKLERVLTAGLLAPTNDHLRNWEFVVIDDKAVLQEVLTAVKPAAKAQLEAVRQRSMQTTQKDMYADAVPKQHSMLYSAGCVVLPFFKQVSPLLSPASLSGLNGFASIWCCIENMLLAATAEGLAAAIRIPSVQEIENIQKVLRHPQEYALPCYIALGYSAPDAPMPAQVFPNLADRLHKNRW